MADPKAPAKEPVVPALKVEVAEKAIPMLKVKVHDKLKAVPKEDLEQIQVWYGTRPDSPFVNFGLGGVCFAANVHHVRAGSHGAPDTVVPQDGNLHKMTKLRIEEILGVIGKTIFRMGGGRVEVWDVESKDYVQDVNDVPVAKFLYMVAVKEGAPFTRDAGSAPSLV